MAIEKRQIAHATWSHPAWPNPLPEPSSLRLLYGEVADELVVLFDARLHRGSWFDPISTPDYNYAAVKVDAATGQVIGVLVYPLVAYAVEKHPFWLAAAAPDPKPEVASRIVRDIKDLFDRYGTEPPDSEQN